MEKTLHALGITRRYKGYQQLLYALTIGQKPLKFDFLVSNS